MERKIVIIEDDRTIQKTLSLILKDKYKIAVYSTGEEALEEIDNDPIDLIITDYKLPGINGLEIIEKLRKQGFRGKTILVSAYPDLINVKDIEKFGVDYLFVKPLDLNKLIMSIRHLLS
ncbi:response regulator [Candidatus Aminicenantes bacterium AC-335-K20]|nr:response regulator [SCandidatus Aminicenantes bacterium Aminicenantia_JdfR_composite]MCP2596967.1 response regulator [Candidatus Aminicenantes bacterium AC-335-G13]MCP2605941.1 response regulator [Candidatus Aminicenantes bacterium AC-708-I09]MCP2618280.1 response regulator [Candidatus Aminicenantes bacterium AC-335-A11]MCP2619563.1 response regulator [Candidatus Aminicenantes bacterium AC-335-K20]MCP2620385.1 response regulator [Candidatus Aminicenantes bacterium AC-334-E05]